MNRYALAIGGLSAGPLSPCATGPKSKSGASITASSEIYKRLKNEGLIALTYTGVNPNGSEGDVAGITDTTGRILGLMPHPEAYLSKENHPTWKEGDGLQLFKNGVDAALAAARGT